MMNQPMYNDEEKDIAQEWATQGSERQLAERLARYRVKILAEAACQAHEAMGTILVDKGLIDA
jgi:hypothetical protein